MKGTLEHLLLKKIYVNSIEGISSTLAILTRQLGLIQEILEPIMESLIEKESLIKEGEDCCVLTPLGRKQLTVVMTGGTFDLLHTGHVSTLQQSKLLGDVLVVVIATDEIVQNFKNHPPTNKQDERAQLVKNIRDVDVAFVGDETDFMKTVDLVNPDIITLGYDQRHNEKKLFQQLSSRGHKDIKIVRLKKYIPGKSTSKIVQDIIKHSYRD